MDKALKDSYGYLFENSLLDEISEVGIFKTVPANTRLIEIGQYMNVVPLLINGAIKILREDDNGDELLLYFLGKGETCAMTLTCCLGSSQSEIRAITETETYLVLIPSEKMEVWIGKYKSWRNFVFASYQDRLKEMLGTIDSLAFLKMDERIMKFLNEKSRINNDNNIHNTHLEIAKELNTSRVVVSRILKTLELEGKIQLGRNSIKILA